MPFVHVSITRDGTSLAQKRQLVREITDTLERVLGKQPDLTHIVIAEVDTDDWGHGGELVTERRAREAAGR
ncbi:4-oxalocrotonate tautomerase family protein [Pseudoxanthomonas mexicana]|uniref:tautomerase family protein n=1 Tax=Pseudoxanthomonas TaxID=83618 RepID=UPI0011542294|nr:MULTISPECIES: 4-oxalocrotonate tautomerase family protein [Pseudoxanthomonas]TQM12127.1 4-oxalocrotonate tautomerase [Pseudoxanthomonas sp. 3HH-4]UOV05481.1 4-oxalocrotonate tautomerase family protein [Pseudoxanthomonas mexicana]